MTDNEYLESLPKNELLAANRICSDYFALTLTEDPKDIVHILEVLLGDKLKDGWDRELKVEDDQNLGFFGKGHSKSKIEKRIELIHRNVKALTAKAMIAKPALINIFLIELNDGEKKKIEDALFTARDLLREAKAKDSEETKGLLRTVGVFQLEADRKHSDFRVFLNGIIEAMDIVVGQGAGLKPVFEHLRKCFDVVDKARKLMEAKEVSLPQRALPPPVKPKLN